MDEVVAYNIKRLRIDKSRGWTATELAEKLTEVLDREYTRFMVSDMEGRRERAVRWTEVAALCSVFDVRLWDLVLPPDGVEVASAIARGENIAVEVTDTPSDDPDLAEIGGVKVVGRYHYPGRDDLSWRLFSLSSGTLEGGIPQKFLSKHEEERQHEELLKIADALLPRLRKEFEREGSDE